MKPQQRGYSTRYADATIAVHGDGEVRITQGNHTTIIDKETFLALAQLFCATTWGSFACGYTPGADDAWLIELNSRQGQFVKDFIQGNTDVGFFVHAKEAFESGAK